jgi:uncharacterized protein (DUF1697 family)
MPRYVALLRAVNVSGTGKLPMTELKAMCVDAGFDAVQTYIASIKGQQDEQVRLGKREIYVAYGNGIGRSKLKIPEAIEGTARNINTIAKLAELAAED